MNFTVRIGGAVVAGATLLGLSGFGPAKAAYVVTLTQQGPDVVATGSGSIDLSDLSFLGPSSVGGPGGLDPDFALVSVGSGGVHTGLYSGAIVGPSSFGSGGPFLEFTASGSGDAVEIQFDFTPPFLGVPAGYASGDPLSSISTFDNATFESLGVTPGTYVWTWGNGADADSFALNIPAPDPEPSTWAMLLAGFAGLGVARWRASRGARLSRSDQPS